MDPIITEIKCTKCLKQFDLTMFSIHFRGDYYKQCNDCGQKSREYDQTDHKKEYSKIYRGNNKEKQCDYSKQWKIDNMDRVCGKVECENCGSITTRQNQPRHKRTTKCKEFNNK